MEKGSMKGQKFLIRKRHRNFREASGEKERNTRNMPNGLKISGGTLNTNRNKNCENYTIKDQEDIKENAKLESTWF